MIFYKFFLGSPFLGKILAVILNKSNYIRKVNNIIEEGLQQGKYIETIDATQRDLKYFQDFLYRHCKKSEHHDQMRPVSNNQVDYLQLLKPQVYIIK